MGKGLTFALLPAALFTTGCETIATYGAPVLVDVISDVLGVGEDDVDTVEEDNDGRTGRPTGLSYYKVELTDGRTFLCTARNENPTVETTSCEGTD